MITSMTFRNPVTGSGRTVGMGRAGASHGHWSVHEIRDGWCLQWGYRQGMGTSFEPPLAGSPRARHPKGGRGLEARAARRRNRRLGRSAGREGGAVNNLTRYTIDFSPECHLQPEDAHLQGIYDLEAVEVYLVADVEAANGWRYDEPEEAGWYLASAKGFAFSVLDAYWRTDSKTWNVGGVYAWKPLPAPAKERT